MNCGDFKEILMLEGLRHLLNLVGQNLLYLDNFLLKQYI
jgi:hypothetical protein